MYFCLDVVCQDDDEVKKKLCKDKEAGELFRLSGADCRNVIQCTAAVRTVYSNTVYSNTVYNNTVYSNTVYSNIVYRNMFAVLQCTVI